MSLLKSKRLKKELTLLDVYVISTGAMFSSGFFLLPGIAAAQAGPSVVLAYLLSGFLILPAMVSQAELSTAMPKAGGSYYFLDRTLGPLVGLIGGLGTWVALMLKSAFALIGMGAYLALFFDVPLKPMAILFTLVFAVLNIVGAKESTRLLHMLVVGLLVILGFFLVHGLAEVASSDIAQVHRTRFTPFMPTGIDGLLQTVGLVFISYVGLTQVASVAEEVTNPDRNLPLGMFLSLATVTAIYVAGVYVMVAVLGTDAMSGTLTPVADAAGAFFRWLPSGAGVILLVVAALAAFASMANAGIMAASRYPLAMARDRMIPEQLGIIGRFHTPVAAIVMTCAILVTFLLVLDVVAVAKVASSLQLIIFALLNFAVIVMRESGIEGYDPGFRSPLYPWMQIVGIGFPFFLIAEMGWLPALFILSVVAVGIAWYHYYARAHIARGGAIFHVFERLGRHRFLGLDSEFRDILKEKGVRAEDPFDEVVARAFVVDLPKATGLSKIVQRAADLLGRRLPTPATEIGAGLTRCVEMGGIPVANCAALVHTRLPDIDLSEMVVIRCGGGVEIDVDSDELARRANEAPIHALFLLVSGDRDPGRHLRILAHLAGRIEDEEFMDEWLQDRDEQELKETLLRDERFLSLELTVGSRTEALIGHALKDLHMPEGSLVALIRRSGRIIVPRGGTVLIEGDRLTIIGESVGLREVTKRYGEEGARPRRMLTNTRNSGSGGAG
jgi:amino acid transporter/mannitol/fructose-specific phosphotransferase system IIA component (Ntr-type)